MLECKFRNFLEGFIFTKFVTKLRENKPSQNGKIKLSLTEVGNHCLMMNFNVTNMSLNSKQEQKYSRENFQIYSTFIGENRRIFCQNTGLDIRVKTCTNLSRR